MSALERQSTVFHKRKLTLFHSSRHDFIKFISICITKLDYEIIKSIICLASQILSGESIKFGSIGPLIISHDYEFIKGCSSTS